MISPETYINIKLGLKNGYQEVVMCIPVAVQQSAGPSGNAEIEPALT